jgi:membrane-associated phospholipid phosphatase
MKMPLSHLFASVVLFTAIANAAPAQTVSGDTTRARVSLVRERDIFFAAGMGGAIAAAITADRSVERSLQRPGARDNSLFKGVSNITGGLGDPGSVIISAGLYFAGLGLHSRRTAALGMHTGDSVVLGGLVSELLKGEIGRARPKFSPDNSRLFKTGKGYSDDDYASLPSTETTVAFAAASSLAIGINRDWPGHARIVTPAAYTLASMVGFSRLYKNEHWLSDVVAAGGLGIASAVFVDRFNLRYTGNVFERWFLPNSIVPEHHGYAIEWVR